MRGKVIADESFRTSGCFGENATTTQEKMKRGDPENSNIPEISVIVVAYNAKYIIIDCINSLVNQTYSKEKYEIIVVIDDKQTYDTVTMISGLRCPIVKVHYREIPGNIPSARNAGINLSKGSIIAFTDSDCIAPDDWLERLHQDFIDFPSISGVGGAIKPYSLDPVSRALALLHMVSRSGGERSFTQHLATSNAAYRKEILIKTGGFDEHALVGEDIDIYNKITKSGYQVLFDPEVIIFHKHRVGLLKIFLWCYSSSKKSIYVVKKYHLYKSLVRQITPALLLVILIPLLILLNLMNALLFILVIIILTYITIFLHFRNNEFFSGRAGILLPVIILTISFGFLFGLIHGILSRTKT